MIFHIPEIQRGLIIFPHTDDGGKPYEKIIKHYLSEQGQKIFDIETK
jgi:hypothetical protein